MVRCTAIFRVEKTRKIFHNYNSSELPFSFSALKWVYVTAWMTFNWVYLCLHIVKWIVGRFLFVQQLHQTNIYINYNFEPNYNIFVSFSSTPIESINVGHLPSEPQFVLINWLDVNLIPDMIETVLLLLLLLLYLLEERIHFASIKWISLSCSLVQARIKLYVLD